MVDDQDEDWFYHLPAFLDQVRDDGAHDVVGNLDVEVGGVLYHHRGVRVPAHDATFLWREGSDERSPAGEETHPTFELELDAVGDRAAWVAFDADRDWDFYLWHTAGDAPCLVWMTDAEFESEEAGQFPDKQEAVGTGRFSFGLYLEPPQTWEGVEERARDTAAPYFVYDLSGRTFVPGEDPDADVVPPEVRPDGATPPDYLGVVDAHVAGPEE